MRYLFIEIHLLTVDNKGVYNILKQFIHLLIEWNEHFK